MRRGIVIISSVVLVITCAVVVSKLNAPEELTAYQKWAQEKIARKQNGEVKADSPEMMGIINRELRTKLGEDHPGYEPNYIMKEYKKAKLQAMKVRNQRSYKNSSSGLNFVERGPGNVAGRTRAFIIDPDDATGQTWFAGSASGGIWKTTDGGDNWEWISSDIPNLGTNTLAMAPSNPQILYAGTGEHFVDEIDGSGMFKSTDKGQTWTQIANPADFNDFRNVSRIIVNPADENEVVVTCRNSLWEGRLEGAIYKTTDGGTSWTRTRTSTTQRYDDIDYDPSDWNTMYVAVAGFGVIKSTDAGETWFDANAGMNPSRRVEITVSSVNTDRIWASAEGGVSGTGSDLYVSDDGAQTWQIALNASGANEDFLGGQGFYDNIITAHPFDEDIVYVGGVNTFKFELTGTTTSITSIDTDQGGSEAFMSFINFGGDYLGGGLSIEAPQDELRSIEIRFGVGTQKAHRFTVNGRGSGVPDSDYEYEDYVDVPFQVWDTENNVQLMAAFRDQQEEGAWNLIESNTDGNEAEHSREYLFIYNVEYSETPDASIGQDGGVDNGRIYFFWPILTPGGTFDSDNLPASTLTVELVELSGQERVTDIVSDAYNDFDGTNSFPQNTRTAGLHPDQHNIVIGDIDEANGTFRLYITNDGGVYESISSTDPGPNTGDFDYVSYGYNTMQFYGADKAPGEYRFIGGTQDNGTWYTPAGTEGSASADYVFGIGGDGFESLWHSTDPDKMIGGSQFNGLARTTNGGTTWQGATNGLPSGSGQAPFITKLAHNKSRPDDIFAIGFDGVYKSENFGENWTGSTMNDPDLWLFSSSTDVEVSYANPDVVWGGTYLATDGRPHVSIDGGETFNAVENYDVFDMGFSSGIYTHPSDENTAYALFSFSGFPKVLKTDDLGQTWEDISGFDGTGDRGFPNVPVNCLFVFPTDLNKIWVGSEIGIIESLDGGASWNLLESDLPPLHVFDFQLTDNTLVLATYGRGIWSVDLESFSVETVYTSPDGTLNFEVNFGAEFESTAFYINETLIGTIGANEIGTTQVSFPNQGFNGNVTLGLLASTPNGSSISANSTVLVIDTNEPADSYGTNFDIAINDFVGNGFTVASAGNFSRAINSDHPYEEGATSHFYLKTPITVSSSDANMYYRDIALVNSSDFVTVEGSSDGLNWTQLITPYNSSLHSEWEDQLDGTAGPTSWIYKDQSLDLSQSFDAGEDILIRFTLSSAAGSTAYGWQVDDLYIQQDPVLSSNKELETVIYPTVASRGEVVKIVSERGFDSQISVFDVQGNEIGGVKNDGQNTNLWSTSNVSPGVYFVKSDGGLLGKVIVK